MQYDLKFPIIFYLVSIVTSILISDFLRIVSCATQTADLDKDAGFQLRKIERGADHFPAAPSRAYGMKISAHNILTLSSIWGRPRRPVTNFMRFADAHIPKQFELSPIGTYF